MQKSLPPLVATLGFLCALFVATLFHAAFFDDRRNDQVKTLSVLTTLPGPAFSAAEPKFRHPAGAPDSRPFVALPQLSPLTITTENAR